MFCLISQSTLIEEDDHGKEVYVYFEMRVNGPVQESFCQNNGRQED